MHFDDDTYAVSHSDIARAQRQATDMGGLLADRIVVLENRVLELEKLVWRAYGVNTDQHTG